ncbi:MAG: class I SAM-dependent methyltransferase [Magnetococcales bacterium]|nr:class I SAM-dependent methyltransferase [Magnetococcales bacterium]
MNTPLVDEQPNILSEQEIAAYIEQYDLKKVVPWSGEPSDMSPNDSVDPNYNQPFYPDWPDLVRLHSLVLTRKVTTILEFGCGYSTLVMAHALAENQRRHGAFVEANLRRNNPHELHAVDDEESYIQLTRERIPEQLAKHVHFHHAQVAMTRFNGRICTEYERLPNICPDFIYLDGPGQFSVVGEINGISTRTRDRLPMASDLLAMEHFFLPGTLIVVDGRTANARFLWANFQREWDYYHDEEGDVHYFELRELPLGYINEAQLRHCLGDGWLESL